MPASELALPLVGAHVSVAGGLLRSLARARRIGAEALQVFPSNPRQWRRPAYDPDELAAYRGALAETGLPLFVHSIYLINPASPDPSLRRRSAQALGDALVFGARSGAQGVVTHVGSHRGAGPEEGMARVAETVHDALSGAKAQLAARVALPRLLLETSAGAKSCVGATIDELADLIDMLPHGCGVCLDTAHAFAAGHPIHHPAGLEAFLARLDGRCGLERVGLVHLNDCATELGSRRDRHENLGEGCIGRQGLGLWLRHPALRRVPFVLETPGFDCSGPDRRNVGRAKRWRAAAAPA